MDALNQAIAQISDVLWNSVLLFLLVGTGESLRPRGTASSAVSR